MDNFVGIDEKSVEWLKKKDAKAMSINLRIAEAEKEYQEAIAQKYIAGLELTKDEALIKFILENKE